MPATLTERFEHCPVAQQCGGCPMIFLPESVQKNEKCALVTRALQHVGLAFPEPRWVPGGARFGYRNRLRLRIDDAGRLGFFNLEKAHDCGVLEPELRSLIHRLRELTRSQSQHMRQFAHVEVRAPDADALSGACYTTRGEISVSPATLGVLEELGSDVLVCVKGALPPEAVPRQRRMLDEKVFCYVPLDAFVQVNTSVNRGLVATLRALAISHEVTSVTDLYAGSGNLTLPLLAQGVSAVAVESHASAAHALRLAAKEQAFDPLEILVGDAAGAALMLEQRGHRSDLLVVDAPRAGVRAGLSNMARLSRRHIALVSCNPGTLARDAAVLEHTGFHLRELFLFDMFAQTRHLEVLAWLSRE